MDTIDPLLMMHPTHEEIEALKIKAQHACNTYTAMFADVEVADSIEILEDPTKFLLIDCRTAAEQAVSVINGAVLQSEFEAENYNDTRTQMLASKTLVPYCTIGYRSGVYARKLKTQYGATGVNIKNGEGVLMWTHKGGSLVELENRKEKTSRIHTFGSAWNLAPSHTEAVFFGPWEMWLRVLVTGVSQRIFGK
eukprot:m.108142 g.108142  ORF g.108142 m.108142 type:complete len:194 (+) comp27850_c0_seq1:278-859(+)